MSLRSLKKGSLVVRNMQKIVKVDTKLLKADVSFLRTCLGMNAYDTSVICVGKKKIADLNMQMRGKDGPTEILSFPYQQSACNGKFPLPDNPCDYNLGDIYLCVPLIKERCFRRGISLRVNILRYVAHGLCHLVGYRHDTEKNWKTMFLKEKEILELLSYYRRVEVEPAYEMTHFVPELGTLWMCPRFT